jgi:CTD small phosphatase-like protein 2
MNTIRTQQNFRDISEEHPDELDCKEETENTYKMELKIARELATTHPGVDNARKIELGKKTKKHTLVLDIDQTLVNTVEIVSSDNEDSIVEGYKVQIRPYAIQMIKSLSKTYEIVLFTAGSEEYAERIRFLLDPKRIWITKTLGLGSCIVTEDGYCIKDLRIFADRDLKNIVIVDDKITSFAFQIDNGVPISPFFGEEDDNELQLLIYYLEELYAADDIPTVNRAKLSILNN